jgi:hypothetical protein
VLTGVELPEPDTELAVPEAGCCALGAVAAEACSCGVCLMTRFSMGAGKLPAVLSLVRKDVVPQPTRVSSAQQAGTRIGFNLLLQVIDLSILTENSGSFSPDG